MLFDRVDGEVARYKRVFSLRGIFLDEINHLIVPPLFFLSLGWRLRDVTLYDNDYILLASLLAAFSALLIRVTHNIPYAIFLKKYIKHKDILPLPPISVGTNELRQTYSTFYIFLKTIHQFHDFFITVFLFALTIILEHFFLRDAFLFPKTTVLLFAYAALYGLIALENILKTIITIPRKLREIESTLNHEG